MFERDRTRNNTRRDSTRAESPLDAVERGYVVSVSEVEESDFEEPDHEHPIIAVEPHDSASPVRCYVPHFTSKDRGLPPEGSVVYFLRTTRDRAMMLGAAAVDHDGYRFERRFDHPATDGLLRWDDEGNLRLESETVERDDEWNPIDHPPKEGYLDIDDGELELWSHIDDDEARVELLGDKAHIEVEDGPSITVDESGDTVTVETDSGFTVEVDGNGQTVQVNGGTEPVVYDVEAEMGSIEGMSVVTDIIVHETDTVLVPE